jgi:hypothetical protein
VSGRSVPGREATEFSRALESLRAARLRPEVRLTEVPAPQRIAPYAVALTADVLPSVGSDDELASGRFVLLFDPSAPEPWNGQWRAVTLPGPSSSPSSPATPSSARSAGPG